MDYHHIIYQFHDWARAHCPKDLGQCAEGNLQLILFNKKYMDLLEGPIDEIPLHMGDGDGVIISIIKYRLSNG